MIHYGMTKTAQLAVARGLAELTRGTGVTVNSILPGPTRSEGVNEFVRALGKERGVDEQICQDNASDPPRGARGGSPCPLRAIPSSQAGVSFPRLSEAARKSVTSDAGAALIRHALASCVRTGRIRAR
jgi:NAD(P)-dependent dehydrogenase (short-subunit alcohol dehydrogenase family)